jgi:hypothetical protein
MTRNDINDINDMNDMNTYGKFHIIIYLFIYLYYAAASEADADADADAVALELFSLSLFLFLRVLWRFLRSPLVLFLEIVRFALARDLRFLPPSKSGLPKSPGGVASPAPGIGNGDDVESVFAGRGAPNAGGGGGGGGGGGIFIFSSLSLDDVAGLGGAAIGGGGGGGGITLSDFSSTFFSPSFEATDDDDDDEDGLVGSGGGKLLSFCLRSFTLFTLAFKSSTPFAIDSYVSFIFFIKSFCSASSFIPETLLNNFLKNAILYL